MLGKLIRKNANKIEECDNIFDRIETWNRNPKQNGNIQNFIEDLSSTAFDIFVEGYDIVFYSKQCSRRADSKKATRCLKCDNTRDTIRKILSRATPIGINKINKHSNNINKKINIKLIAAHPMTAGVRIREDALIIKRQRKLIIKQHFENKVLKDLLRCEANSEFEDGVIKVFNEADTAFDKYQLSNISDVGEEKSKQKSLWEVHIEHLINVKEKKGG